ncbi:alkene reductase [Granulicella sp. 5B5]|uniref:alkene reductase n=1 Tax=Granulicella sp. 5B5 TaxID=1617967 RepID=UPI001C70E308|nr:alkene reductase [Granulicella sp. 5B5]
MTDKIWLPLFSPVRMGSLELRNRIVMAPLTRMRADNPEHAPTQLHAEYYAQRADAGLIIGECTEVSAQGYGWADTPGLWSVEQVKGWRTVTDAVHRKGGLMYAQLWHTGAMSHPEFFSGELPVSASDVNPEQESVTPSGRKPTVAPRAMTKAEIRQTVADFGQAARNALEAGFDGVQIQANYLYLIAQFLSSGSNRRTDEYGGSTENRARMLFEITDTVLQYVEPGRVGVKIGPMHLAGPFAANDDTLPDMEYVFRKLDGYGLAHLLLMGANTDVSGSPLQELAGDGMFRHFRPLYRGHVIANVDMTAERGNRLLELGLVDSVAFGRPFIANPDLVRRLQQKASLNEIDWPTVYAAGPEGYTDYSVTEPQAV